MERYRRFLVDGGTIHLKTDSNFLFTYTKYMVENNQLPVEVQTEDLYNDAKVQEATEQVRRIQTYYEQMWLDRGLNIRYMRFHLPQSGTLEEPDVEIELDNYRSYHRPKRSGLERSK
jgi:tRNA (guanine-N7-)-methyltransferase